MTCLKPETGDTTSPKRREDSDSEMEMPSLNALMKSYGPMDNKTAARESGPKAAVKKRAAPAVIESTGSKSKAPKLAVSAPGPKTSQDTTPAAPVAKVDIGIVAAKRKGKPGKVSKVPADKGGLNLDEPDETSDKDKAMDSSNLCEQDEMVLEAYKARLAEFKSIHPPLADAAYKSYLSEVSTKVTLLINDVKTKRRSAMRRALKQQDPLYIALQDVHESATNLQNMLKCFSTELRLFRFRCRIDSRFPRL